ncbi:MAG: hypothetical protein L0Y44_00565 [Phycisphaerales bacterium]|nr:hypothetical protein [Phycisphaerales bacterium]MCI0629129.1 hypothetical protein [Phycisphaerales bacterium]MCI0676668.1 hypothetical protein [Phycisphaerales bacterium]
MLYRFLRSINAWFGLAVLWVCLAAFLLALPLMFIFPQGTLLLLFVGLFGLGLAVIGFKVLRYFEHALARRSLARGSCPRCGQHDSTIPSDEPWRCAACGTSYEVSGNEVTS